MTTYSLTHLSDGALLHDLAALVARDRATTAALLAHLAEVEARRLYAPAGYPSMFAYCVGELRMSEDAAILRIRVARAGRRFPSIFPAIADGRLHLSAVHLLRHHLRSKGAAKLLAAAENKSKTEIERLLAEWFPMLDVPTSVMALSASNSSTGSLVPEPVKLDATKLAPTQLAAETPRSNVAPLSPERFALQITMAKTTHDKLRYAQELLSHAVPSGDVAQVLDCALDALIQKLEKRKFGAGARPGSSRPTNSENARHVPMAVRRAVWARDGGRCTFVSESGHRCSARSLLELDHIDPVARGGEATIQGLRLRCRAHNQYEAERVFGAEFMEAKRQKAREAAARTRERDVTPWLRKLGFRQDETRRAAEYCETLGDIPLEERVRSALSFLQSGARVEAALSRA